jgi:Tfp pilus assembly protein PilX
MRNKFTDQQSGQVIILLLLLMLVGLSVGLALTQRSVNDVTTSTQVEQSSRAFSAAEAGLEKALNGSFFQTGSGTIPLNNDSTAQISQSNYLPQTNSTAAIEYPPIGRETTAQFWFVDPFAAPPPIAYYDGSQVNLYYGNENTTDKPAVEMAVVTERGGNFYTKNYYYDSDSTRAASNRFAVTPSCGSATVSEGILGSNHKFYCAQTVNIMDGSLPTNACVVGNNCRIILARVRFLYINENHNLALQPIGPGIKFPPQVQIYNSVGTSGQSQKQVQAFKVKDVVPPWFDYAIFSVNEIRK